MDFNLQKAIQQRYLPAGVYTLLEISHSKFDKVYNLINNTRSVEIEGTTYTPYPLGFKPRSQGDNSSNSLVLSNVDQSVIKELVKAKDNEDIKVKVWVALVEEKDGNCFIERKLAGTFIIDGVTVTTPSISMSLDLDTSLKFNIGSRRFDNPSDFPNLNK